MSQSFRGVIAQFKIKNRKKCLNFDWADCGISQIWNWYNSNIQFRTKLKAECLHAERIPWNQSPDNVWVPAAPDLTTIISQIWNWYNSNIQFRTKP